MACMTKLVSAGFALLGVGLLSVVGMTFSKWGPCGPSDISGLVCMLSAGISLLLGSLFLVISFFRYVAQKARESSAP
jgi:hypothetical protein